MSETRLRVALAVLAVIGLGIAGYLTTVHYEGGDPVCLTGGESCAKVQESDYAEMAGVPVPLIGVFGYLTILAAAAIRGDAGRLLGLFAGGIGFGFSVYLTYLELFVIDAICQWCIGSAIVMTLAFIVALTRAVRFTGTSTHERAAARHRLRGDAVASRKDEKEQRRQARLEAEQAAASEDRRKKVFAVIGATVLAAVVVVVALIVVNQSGDDGGGDASSINAGIPVLATIDSLDQKGLSVGDPAAKVTISEFGDLQCPACKQFSETVVPELVAKGGPVGAGDAQLEFQNFVIIGDESFDAAKAALAASEQGRYWQFIEIFYANQGIENSGYVTDEFLTGVAEAAGVPDIDAWNESRADPKWDATIADTESAALQAGFTGTPSVLVTGPGGEQVLGTFPDTAAVEQAIEEVR